VESQETLTEEQQQLEAIYLGLRTVEGLPFAAASPRRRFITPAPHFAAQGWIYEEAGSLKCTPEGWLRLDSVVNELAMNTGIQQ
jgi:coproporphyrinogen III oxidase-like Fe-S oxidoreductase